MTPEQIKLAQHSFEQVADLGEIVAKIFYDELFKAAPSLRPMFKGDMRQQGRKLLAALAMVVRGLDRPETIIPAAKQLAIRHVKYGVRSEHYPIVGEALLRTLEKGLGDAFTPELRAAWATAYDTLASVMQAAAYGPEAVPARKAG